MISETRRKKAILFGGTDGHGITMTAISERALKCRGYDVETVCRYERNTQKDPCTKDYPADCGTGQAEFFWGRTFPKWDYSCLKPDDVVMVIDIPLPIQQQISEYSAARAGIITIGNLCREGKQVILVDHHSRALTDYGMAIEAGAELLFSVGAVRYAHYGIPDDYSLFWGSIGAICDRDVSMIPLEEGEKKIFLEFEQHAQWLDQAKEHLNTSSNCGHDPLISIREDCRKIPKISREEITLPDERIELCESVSFIKELTDTKGFKELDTACRLKETPFGLGIGTNRYGKQYILVINYWKDLHTPVALHLHKVRKIGGHDTGISITVENSQDAQSMAQSYIAILNSTKLGKPGKIQDDPDIIDYLILAFAESNIHIPEWLTVHGWPHIQTVFANIQLLATLMNCSKTDQEILNWSALFHDIGNAALNYKTKYPLTAEYTTDSETVRENHHLLTVEILRLWRKEGFCRGKDGKPDLISDEDFEIICDLCCRHRKKTDLPKDEHKKMLCSVLRIADGLDKTKSRARKNDNDQLWSQVHKDLLERNSDKAWESIRNWEGQRAIETIRIYIKQRDKKNHIIFEFLVTDASKAEFIINDFKVELKPLQESRIPGIDEIDVKIVRVPLFN